MNGRALLFAVSTVLSLCVSSAEVVDFAAKSPATADGCAMSLTWSAPAECLTPGFLVNVSSADDFSSVVATHNVSSGTSLSLTLPAATQKYYLRISCDSGAFLSPPITVTKCSTQCFSTGRPTRAPNALAEISPDFENSPDIVFWATADEAVGATRCPDPLVTDENRAASACPSTEGPFKGTNFLCFVGGNLSSACGVTVRQAQTSGVLLNSRSYHLFMHLRAALAGSATFEVLLDDAVLMKLDSGNATWAQDTYTFAKAYIPASFRTNETKPHVVSFRFVAPAGDVSSLVLVDDLIVGDATSLGATDCVGGMGALAQWCGTLAMCTLAADNLPCPACSVFNNSVGAAVGSECCEGTMQMQTECLWCPGTGVCAMDVVAQCDNCVGNSVSNCPTDTCVLCSADGATKCQDKNLVCGRCADYRTLDSCPALSCRWCRDSCVEPSDTCVEASESQRANSSPSLPLLSSLIAPLAALALLLSL